MKNPDVYPIFIKFLQSKYLSEFVENGLLYMNTYDYFRNIEDASARGDKMEGVKASFRSQDISLAIDNIPVEGLINRVNFFDENESKINIFSMTGLSIDNFPSGEHIFYIDKQYAKFGQAAVVITNQTKFIERVRSAFQKNEGTIESLSRDYIRPIQYVPDHFNGPLGPFRKLDIYSWQSELRIGLMKINNNESSIPYKLHIGSIKDIAIVFETSKILVEGLKYTLKFNK